MSLTESLVIAGASFFILAGIFVARACCLAGDADDRDEIADDSRLASLFPPAHSGTDTL